MNKYTALIGDSDIFYMMPEGFSAFNRFLYMVPHEDRPRHAPPPDLHYDHHQTANNKLWETYQALQHPSFSISRRGRLSFHRTQDGEPQSGEPEVAYDWIFKALNNKVDLELESAPGELKRTVQRISAKSNGETRTKHA